MREGRKRKIHDILEKKSIFALVCNIYYTKT